MVQQKIFNLGSGSRYRKGIMEKTAGFRRKEHGAKEIIFMSIRKKYSGFIAPESKNTFPSIFPLSHVNTV